MKKAIIIFIVFLLLGFSFSIGFYIYTANKLEEKIQEADANLKSNIVESTKVSYVNELIEDNIIETVATEEKISPNATLIIEKYYKECGHTTKDYASVPEEIVNKTEEEIKKIYSNWEIKNFSKDEIVLYKEIDGICREHYILKEADGVIAIYTQNEDGEEILEEVTSIAVDYLPEADLNKIKEGIKATGREELNSILEDYE